MSGALQAYYFTSISGKAYWIAQSNQVWSGAVQCKAFANGSNVWLSYGAGGYQSWPRVKITTSGDSATTNPGIYPSQGGDTTSFYVYPTGGQISRGGQHAASSYNYAAYWTDTGNGDYWLSGNAYQNNQNGRGVMTQKVNDAGTQQWATRLYWEGNNSYGQFMDTVSKNGTTWSGGRYFPSQYSTRWSDARALAVRFDGSGNVGIIKQYGSTEAYYAEVDGVSMDNSNNPIFGITWGPYSTGLPYPYACSVENWNSDLTSRNWGKKIWHPAGTSLTDQHTTDIVSIWYDSNTGNTYATGQYTYYPEGPWYRAYLVCFNSSGSVLWQKVSQDVSRSDGLVAVTGIYGDSTGVYWSVYDERATRSHIVIKFNTSGTLQWQRAFGVSAAGTAINYVIHPGSVTCVGNIMYLSGTWAPGGGYSAYSVKLPNDGSFTGTYGNFTWQSSGLSIYDGDLNITDITSSAVQSNWTDRTANFTVETGLTVNNGTTTPTVTRTDIP